MSHLPPKKEMIPLILSTHTTRPRSEWMSANFVLKSLVTKVLPNVSNVPSLFVRIAVKFLFDLKFQLQFYLQLQNGRASIVQRNVYLNIILNLFPTCICVKFVTGFSRKKKCSNVLTVLAYFVSLAVKFLWISAFLSPYVEEPDLKKDITVQRNV
jgi:hypothetical protein